MTEINGKFVDPYWNGQKRHKNYLKALDAFWHVDFHASGYFKKPWVANNTSYQDVGQQPNPYFKRLIDERRPSESKTILAYRRSVYKPVTQTPFSMVLNSLQKIFRSQEYSTDWSNSVIPPSLKEENQLETYCTKYYPYFDSIDNWASKQAMRCMLVDANALCAVMPLSYDIQENELCNPYSHLIPSKDVYEYVENEYCIFLSPFKSTFMSEGEKRTGKILCIFTPESIWEARQINSNGDYVLEERLVHNIGTLPCFLLGGENMSTDAIAPFYESFLKGMLPYLDEMAADSSDLSAEKIQHLYSEKWYYQPQVCKQCNGLGTSGPVIEGKQSICPTCDGTGVAPKSPYQDWVINPKNAMGQDTPMPSPPVGYVQKDTKIIEYMMEIIETHAYNSLSAVHMQFLFNRPLKQSGIAKAYDAQETNNFVSKIAENIITNIIEQVYFYVNEMRYSMLVPDAKTRREMLPKIIVPHTFDLMTETALEQNMKLLNDAGVSDTVKSMAEKQYLNFKYPDSKIADQLQLSQSHDPFTGHSIDDKLALLNSDAVEKVDVVLSLYINAFTEEVLETDEKFLNLKWAQQHEKLLKMAEDKMDNMQETETIPLKDAEGNPLEDDPAGLLEKKKNTKIDPNNKPRKKTKSSLDNA